jgi:ankyrin repeat protein
MARSSTSSNRRPEVTNDYKERLEPRLLRAIELDDAEALRNIIGEAKEKGQLTQSFLGIGLMRSSEKGKISATRFLLEQGARADGATTGKRLSPLMRAVEKDHVAIVQVLLEHKANPNVTDKDGRTVSLLLPSN